MSKQIFSRVGWLVGLLLFSVAVAACGGAATESEPPTTPAEANAPAQVEENKVQADVAEQEPEESPVAEEAAADEAEIEEEAAEETTAAEPAAESNESLLDPAASVASVAECVTVEIPDNPLIATVTEDDWVKGPADAPITLIEYGDFQ